MVYYFIVGLLAFVLMFAFGIGLGKVVKLLIGNYISMIFILALSLGIDILIVHLNHDIFSFLQDVDRVEEFLLDNRVFLLIFIYILLLVVIFVKSTINIELGKSKVSKILYNFVLAPLAVVSILSSL